MGCSTRVTVAFLYSLPLIVLKSSASAIDAKHTIKITNLGVLISATPALAATLKQRQAKE